MKQLNFKSARELIDMDIEDYPMLIEDWIPMKGLTALVGGSGLGKSTLARQLSINVVTEQDHFLGKDIDANHNSVIYVSSEEDDWSLSYLFNKTLPEEIKTNDGLERFKYVFQTEFLIEKLDNHLGENPADLIIIDAFADVFNGNINRVNEVRTYMENYKALVEKYNCAVMFIHHTGKRTAKTRPSKNNVLGSQGFEGKVRAMYEIREDLLSDNRRLLWCLKGNLKSPEEMNRADILNFQNQIFTPTDEQIHIEDYSRKVEKPITETAYPKFKEIQEANPDATVDQLTDIMKNSGIDIGRTSVYTMQKRYKDE